MASVRDVRFIGPAAVWTVPDGQTVWCWQGLGDKLLLLALCTLVKELNLPTGDSLGLAPSHAILCSSWYSTPSCWRQVICAYNVD